MCGNDDLRATDLSLFSLGRLLFLQEGENCNEKRHFPDHDGLDFFFTVAAKMMN